jgi:IS5 family transposase
MALGAAPVEQRFEGPGVLLGDRLRGVYRLLADYGDRLFPDDYFADLYKASPLGRPTVPARVLATVMVLQAQEGLSDQEACDHLECDLRWQAAAGVDAGYVAFHPTVLVGQRNRLRGSERPKRFLEDTKVVARQAGVLKGRARVLDSTPIYDAVATQDTVTQLRAAIRKLLRALTGPATARVREALSRDDDYATPGKPPCDWDDPEAREQLVDALVRDAHAALAAVEGEALAGAAREAAELLAVVAGQDVEAGGDGVFRIARRVAPDRVISTVDPEARHGRKSRNRRFDGYKSHFSVDPDSELIDEVAVTPANAADAAAVGELLGDGGEEGERPLVFGDSAYAGPDTIAELNEAGYEVIAKVPPATNRDGRYTKDDFRIDLAANRVTCPAGVTVAVRVGADGEGRAQFGAACAACPLRERCTTSPLGRTVSIHPKEAVLQRAKRLQATPEWRDAYRQIRPRVERKIAHFVRAAWGGRRARTRGRQRITSDAVTRAAAVNWARLATLGVAFTGAGWAVTAT